MSNALRVAVLLVFCVLGSALVGCGSKDPVIPEADIPAIPPSPRSASAGGGQGAGGSGQTMPAAGSPAVGGGGKMGTGGNSPFPPAPRN